MHVASNIALFTRILGAVPSVSTIIEMGAIVGFNLKTTRQIRPKAELAAVEINEGAVDHLRKLDDVDVYHRSILDFVPDRQREMVLVKGALIHTHPDMLPQVYDLMYRTSNKYICIAEYYNPTPVQVKYRGYEERLFKRDFAGEMLGRFDDYSGPHDSDHRDR